MRDKSKVVRTALRAAKRRRYDIGGVADPYGMIDPEEELRRKNPLYQNTGDFTLFSQQPFDPNKDQQTPGPNTNAGQLFAGIPNGLNLFGGTPTTPDQKSNDMVPYSNANYQPGAVQSANLAPPAYTVDPFSAYITGALAGLPTTPSGQMPAFVSTPFTPDPVTPSQPATRGVTISDEEEVPANPASTPTQVAALTPATTPNQMFSESGKFTGRIGEPLPGSFLPAIAERQAANLATYGNLSDTFAANQAPTPTAAEVNQSLPGAVSGQNITGSFDPLASQDILGDVSYGVFGLSGPTGLSNAMQQTDEQVSEQEAQQEAEQAAAEQAAAEQAAAEQAAEQPGGGQEESPGGGAPEAGDSGPEEKRGGRIYRRKYATDGFVDDLLARKQADMDPSKALLFGNADQALPPTGLPIGQAVGTKAAVDTAKGILDASKLTQEALEGRLPPDYFQSDEGIGRALSAAGMGMAGGIAGVPARAGEAVLGSGPIKKELNIVEQINPHKAKENLFKFLKNNDQDVPDAVYHASKSNVETFDPKYKTELSPFGFHFGTADQANFRIGQYDFQSKTPNIGKYHLSIKKPLEVSHMGSYAPDHLADHMMDIGILHPDRYDAILEKHDYEAIPVGNDLVKILKKNGYDALKYKNEKEGEGYSFVPFDPHQIKSATGNRGTFDPTSPKLNEARGGEVSYPLAKDGKDKLTYMKPKKFLAKSRSLNMDKDDRTTIDQFKAAIKKGQSLDPLALYPHNRENGRHRAMAAKELGIKKVPVHNYRNEARGGSIVDKALMLTSRRLAAAKAPK